MVRTFAGLTAIGMTVGAVQAQVSLRDVMQRVGGYVDSYGDRASIVVATEKYSQREVEDAHNFSSQRDLVSDLAIIQTQEHRWVGFRDVLEVDGKAIEDRRDRLVGLLKSGTLDEARRVSDENARFNVGQAQRNFNVPTTALFFFTGENLGRFRFKSKGAGANGIWSIDFQETSAPTLIHEPNGKSILSQGTIWAEPDGAVVRTHLGLHLVNADVPTAPVDLTVYVDVTYKHVATLDMWLPAVMTESYESRQERDVDRISTRADYSNYRTFQTSVKIK
jgi:hypothetical protein